MKLINKIVPLILVSSLLISGCTTANPISTAEVQTLVAKTVEVLKTDIALQPTQTAVAQAETPVPLLPTFTSIPTLAPTATSIPPTATETVSLVVGSVEDLSSTGTLKGGETFVKTWRITNGGTSAWTKDYKIVRVNGDNMGVSSISLGKVVYPGDSIKISVTFTAPVKAGAHSSGFMMETNNGYKFGLGAKSGSPWSFSIKVENVFSVSAATISSPGSYSGTCPATIYLVPQITVNGSGVVTYYVITPAGNSDTYSITFSGSGTATGSSVSLTVDSSMTSLNVNIYVDNPNHQSFNSVTIPITCTP
jgi:hypothetical protein